MSRQPARPWTFWQPVAVVAAAIGFAAPACAAIAQTSAESVDGLTATDGYLPAGRPVSPFDVAQPAVANLDPELRAAIQQAAVDAREDGVTIMINTGWRSRRYQQWLLDEAVGTYGSKAEARKRVNTPDRSTHVTGEAVDAGPPEADRWLIRHGAAYGLCQVYANEIWHFEIRTSPGGTCPPPLPDASAG
jgi:hypothetical protein